METTLEDLLAKSEPFQALIQLQKEGKVSKIYHSIEEIDGAFFLKLTPVWSKSFIEENQKRLRDQRKSNEPMTALRAAPVPTFLNRPEDTKKTKT